MSATSTAASVSVVLVHGGFVDGSGWQGVYNILQQHGYRVSIVQNPTISLDDDVAVTKRVIAAQRGPVVLVGHPYWAWLSRRPATIRRLLGSLHRGICAGQGRIGRHSHRKSGTRCARLPPILPPQDGFHA